MKALNQYAVWTALITPFDENQKIDYNSLKQLIAKQQKANNAILIIGSTGEGLALTLNEKKEFVKFVSGLNLTIPVMVGVGGFNLEQQLEWISFCNDYPIDAYLLVTPLYAKPGIQGQTNWFEALLNKASKPCMLYNIPSRTGVSLYPDVLKNLAGHSNLWALKDASGQIETFRQYRNALASLAIYSGEDALMPELAKEGTKGSVSASANIWPEKYNQYIEKCFAHTLGESAETWKKSIKTLFQLASNPIPVKVLLHHKNEIKTPFLRPPLSHQDLTDFETLLKADKMIEEL